MERIIRPWACALLTCLACLLAPGASSGQEEDGAIILTAEEIKALKANKMADLLNHVPGVSAGDTSVSIHGSSKVRVLVDGRPINDPTSSYGAINWSMVDPDQVERIEILRGKGGVRYGQDAGGGVILVTTRAISAVSGSIKTYGGNQDTGYAGANVQARRGQWGAEAGGEVETTQGYTINGDSLRHRCCNAPRLARVLSLDTIASFSATRACCALCWVEMLNPALSVAERAD